MIIHLDSDFRDRALYPNPSSYAIEINGTPPTDVRRSDARSCFLTENNILFSFYYFQQSPVIPYTGFSNGTAIVIDLSGIVLLSKALEMPASFSQNYFMGYVVRDEASGHSSIVRISTRDSIATTRVNLFLENPISPTGVTSGTLRVLNPSSTATGTLLINGYSTYNSIPNTGFFLNDGVCSTSILINLTRGTSTSIRSVSPYRNVLYKKPFEVNVGDYIVVLENPALKEECPALAFNVLRLYPVGLRSFSDLVLAENGFSFPLAIGAIFLSDFGDGVDPVYTPIDGYYALPSDWITSSPSRKMVLRVAHITPDGKPRFVIDSPGNQIEVGQRYRFTQLGFSDRELSIRVTSTSLSVRTDKPLDLVQGRHWMVYFLSFFLARPYYAVVRDNTTHVPDPTLLFLEYPCFFDGGATDEVVYLYEKIGCIPFSPFFPNLVIPASNLTFACYRIQLSSLTMPNLPICGTEFILADFPYVLVTFGNMTSTNTEGRAGTTSLGTLWSNNPAATQATFMCAIANIRSPDIIKYVVVRSAQVVTIKLNLSQNIRISVYLPDGTLLRYSKSFQIDLRTNRFIPADVACSQEESLNCIPSINNNTPVFPFNDEYSISATFALRQIS